MSVRMQVGQSIQRGFSQGQRGLSQSQKGTSEGQKGAASPVRYLLQNNIKLNVGHEGERGVEQIQLIGKLLKQCSIFAQLGIDLNEGNTLRELCQGVVLIFCESPHIMEAKDNELYIFLEGQGFEYMQGEGQGIRRSKMYQGNQFVMVRKICANDYFLSLPQAGGRYHAVKRKYQMMVDENTLLGKISDELFGRLFAQRIVERQRNLVAFLKKIEIFAGLPLNFFVDLSKYVVDQEMAAGRKMVQKGERSRWVYLIRSGEVEVRRFGEGKKQGGPNYYIAGGKAQKLGEYQSFGMEQQEILESGEKEIACLTPCKFCKIQKRLLAIVVTSFELDFQQKGRWSEVNINSQIKGQSYCSPQQQLLLRNAERIRSSQKKARDLKLRFLSTKKGKRSEEDQIQKLSREKSIRDLLDQRFDTLQNSRILSPEQKRRMIKTTEGRFRSTSIMRFINNFGGIFEDTKCGHLRRQLINPGLDQDKKISNIELLSIEDQQRSKSPTLRHSNAFGFRQKVQRTKFSRSASKFTSLTQAKNKFIPRLQAKMKLQIPGNVVSKFNSDVIGVFLDKKIKNQIVRKAQKVLKLSKSIKLIENKNLKRLFAVKECKAIGAMSQQDKKSIAEDIVDRMTNLRDNPLLLQIENQRRKVERQIKLTERRPKAVTDSPRKYRPEDELILIRNNNQD